MKVNGVLRNFSYVILSNVTTLLISSFTILFIPKLIGVESYGYFQLYMFYIGYVGFFHLGWPDGIYLKFGGKEYKELDRNYFKEQFFAYNIYLFTISLLVFLLAFVFEHNQDKLFILLMTVKSIILCKILYNVLPVSY